MSTSTVTEPPEVTTGGRIATVLRLTGVDARVRMSVPWLILGAIFLVNVAIWWAVRASSDDGGQGTTGALTALFFIIGSTYLVTMTQTMPFALSLGITRRHFYAGVVVRLAGETLVHAVALTALLLLERATDGWGLRMGFFSLGFVPPLNPLLQVLCFWVPLLSIGTLFLLFGAVFRRWGQYGVWALAVAGVLAAGLAVFWVTWQSAWPAVGRFFTGTPVPVLLAVHPLVLAAVAVAVGYLVVRRARV
ncbi:hypothetical protein [Pseudonocardia spirodelae]|uniref:ABC transporter permease n=1 Tax=Pseudonocardia spirodelae TaxID=3133431 RepID=A0ABU8TCQ0_9PSEU